MSKENRRPSCDEYLLRHFREIAPADNELGFDIKKVEADFAGGARQARERSDIRFERVKPKRKLIV